MKKTITIHQCEHLVWLGLIDKISKANVFVLADTFDFKKNYYENRNKIRTKDGWQWLTVPIEKDNHKPINEVNIIYNENWQKKYLESIKYNYRNSPYFNKYYPEIEMCIMEKYGQTIYISDLNEILLKLFLKWFNINTPVILSSTLELNESLRSSERLLEICQKVGADTYLSGSSGKNYLNLDLFEKNNIKVVFHEFIHPIYKQQYEPFIPGMSALDYLFNCGGKIA
jgi:hypothetical protein